MSLEREEEQSAEVGNVLCDEEGQRVVSDEELDDIADAAIDVIRDILVHFESQGSEINEYEGDDGEIILDIVGADLAILIGKHGHTLDAVQTLVSAITHRVIGYRYPVSIDVESYKHRQRQKLVTLAQNAAKRARSQKRDVSLKPMTPYERRIIHMALRDENGITTFSEGVEAGRHVIVHPV